MSDQKKFPIMREKDAKPHPISIPWSIAELAYSGYRARFGDDQSMEVLAGRGGFAPSEMDQWLPNWREQCSEILQLRIKYDKAIDELLDEVEAGGLRINELEAERQELNAQQGHFYRVCPCGCIVCGDEDHPCDKCGSLEQGQLLITSFVNAQKRISKLEAVVGKLPSKDQSLAACAANGDIRDGDIIWNSSNCRCDYDVGMAPCEYCAIHTVLIRTLDVCEAAELVMKENNG